MDLDRDDPLFLVRVQPVQFEGASKASAREVRLCGAASMVADPVCVSDGTRRVLEGGIVRVALSVLHRVTRVLPGISGA